MSWKEYQRRKEYEKRTGRKIKPPRWKDCGGWELSAEWVLTSDKAQKYLKRKKEKNK